MQPVLIVGAGPSGLVLALSLRKNGIPVRIIDKELVPRLGERGAGVQARSLELHHVLGTISDVLSSGRPFPHCRVHDLSDNQKPPEITPLIPFVEPQFHTPYPNVLMLGQSGHEKILRTHLEKMGTVVEFGSELKGFEQLKDHVTVQIIRRLDGKESVEETQVPWLIGADGAHSIVRKTLALSFLGETRENDEMVIGDIKVKAGLDDPKFWERWVGSPNIAYIRPSSQDPNVYTFILGGPDVDCDKIMSNNEELVKTFYSVTKRTDIIFGDIVWISKYRPNIRMVQTLRVGRVFIAGDAAHCHTPTGGQGLNSSIQDSLNLAWKLSLVYKGYTSAAFLDSYQEERLPVIAQMLNKTTELFDKVLEKRGAINQAERVGMSQLGVNYRGSSIIGEDDIRDTTPKVSGYNKDSETAACPGDRAPEVPSLIDTTGEHKTKTLFDIFSPSYHSVLVFTKKYDENLALTLSNVINRLPGKTAHTVLILPPKSNVNQLASAVYDEVLIDSGGHAYASYGLSDDESYIVVVRPDSVVGVRVREVAGVEHYFQKIFS